MLPVSAGPFILPRMPSRPHRRHACMW